jgi:hypothetical protein
LSRNAIGSRNGRPTTKNIPQALDESAQIFAPECGQINSLKFVLEKTVKDRVDQTQCRQTYKLKVAEHDRLMHVMSQEVKILNQRKKASKELEQYDELMSHMLELEDNVQSYLIQIELVEDELEKLRAKWPSVDEEVHDNKSICLSPRKEESTQQMLSRLDSPVLCTLLWNVLDSYSKSEVSASYLFHHNHSSSPIDNSSVFL